MVTTGKEGWRVDVTGEEGGVIKNKLKNKQPERNTEYLQRKDI